MGFREFDGELDAPKAYREFDGELDAPQDGADGGGGLISDIGVAAHKGAVAFNQSLIGVGDLLTGGRVGKAIKDAGYDAAARQRDLDTQYSEETQAANRAVQEADGFVDTVKAAVSNPRAIGASVIESIPQMIGGAGVAKGLIGATGKALAPVYAGAAGEGVVAAGSTAESIRESSDSGVLTGKQSLAALASGIGTGAFGALGGKIAGSKIGQKIGLADIDTIMAQGGPNALLAGQAKQGFIKSVIGSGISEGVLEELPQSVQEQMWQNFALDKPISEGVGNAAAMGLLAGAAMGGVGGGYNAIATKPAPQPKPQLSDIVADGSIDQSINAAQSFVDSAIADSIPVDELLTGLDDPVMAQPAEQPTPPLVEQAAPPIQTAPVSTQASARPIQTQEASLPPTQPVTEAQNGTIPVPLEAGSVPAGSPAIGSDNLQGGDATSLLGRNDAVPVGAGSERSGSSTTPVAGAGQNQPVASNAAVAQKSQESRSGTLVAEKSQAPATSESGDGVLANAQAPVAPVFGTNAAGRITLRGAPTEHIKAVRDKLGLKGIIIGKDSAMFPKGTDLKALQAEFKVAPATTAVKQKKAQRASTDLLQRIKQLGGIDATHALDITGEQRAPGAWKFAFRKGGTGIDDLATMLASDGFMIDTSDVDGGAQQLRDMISSHIGGERNFRAASIEATAEKESASRDLDVMAQRADAMGIKWRNLSAQQLSDAVYEAEDALEMERLDAESLSDAALAASDAIVEEEIEIEFGDEIVTDNAALNAWLGDDNEQTTGGNTAQGAGTRAQESAGAVGGQARQEAEAGQAILQGYTNAEVLKREAATKKVAEDARAAEAKSAADKEVSDFTLTGSNRSADIGAAHGQTDIFSAPKTLTAQTENVKPEVPVFTLNKRTAGDGIAYEIKVGGKFVGHLSGFERYTPKALAGSNTERSFHLYKTEISDAHTSLRGTGLYRKAVQQVANEYEGGLWVHEWEASKALRKSLAKMPTYEFNKEREVIRIRPEQPAAESKPSEQPAAEPKPAKVIPLKSIPNTLKIENPATGKNHNARKVMAAANRRVEKLEALKRCVG